MIRPRSAAKLAWNAGLGYVKVHVAIQRARRAFRDELLRHGLDRRAADALAADFESAQQALLRLLPGRG